MCFGFLTKHMVRLYYTSTSTHTTTHLNDHTISFPSVSRVFSSVSRAFLERFFDGRRADYGCSYFDLVLILTFILHARTMYTNKILEILAWRVYSILIYYKFNGFKRTCATRCRPERGA